MALTAADLDRRGRVESEIVNLLLAALHVLMAARVQAGHLAEGDLSWTAAFVRFAEFERAGFRRPEGDREDVQFLTGVMLSRNLVRVAEDGIWTGFNMTVAGVMVARLAWDLREARETIQRLQLGAK